MNSDAFRSGDLVEVRGPEEILATLDEKGALDGLPFMPEMLQYCGRRLVVDKRADKICDNIRQSGSRRLLDTVLLADLRCDGSGHDGCQADCRLFWKNAWLRRVDRDTPPAASGAAADSARAELVARLAPNARQLTDVGTCPAGSWRCQATEMYRASTPVGMKDPRAYLREVASGNVTVGRFLRVFPRAVLDEVRHKLGMLPEASGRPRVRRAASVAAPVPGEEKLNLQPGDWVQVRPIEEIAATLSEKGKNKGLWFDREMIPFAGKTYRVRNRISRFVDEANGRMIVLKNDCVTLEGVVCSGDRSLGRWFCPRGIYPFWREAWLKRVSPPAAAVPGSPADGEPDVPVPLARAR